MYRNSSFAHNFLWIRRFHHTLIQADWHTKAQKNEEQMKKAQKHTHAQAHSTAMPSWYIFACQMAIFGVLCVLKSVCWRCCCIKMLGTFDLQHIVFICTQQITHNCGSSRKTIKASFYRDGFFPIGDEKTAAPSFLLILFHRWREKEQRMI